MDDYYLLVWTGLIICLQSFTFAHSSSSISTSRSASQAIWYVRLPMGLEKREHSLEMPPPFVPGHLRHLFSKKVLLDRSSIFSLKSMQKISYLALVTWNILERGISRVLEKYSRGLRPIRFHLQFSNREGAKVGKWEG